MAAEYILKEGNPNVMLCERGIRTFETAYRFTLDLTAVPVLKELTHLPVIVDPSHAAGRRASSSRCRWPPRPPAPTGSSSRCTRTPRRRSATGRRQLRADGFAEYAEQGRAGRRDRRQGCPLQRPDRVVRIAVVGVGLIGGSIGLAARERLGARRRRLRPGARRARAALARGALDAARRSVAEARRRRGRRCSSPRRSARCPARCGEALGARRRRTASSPTSARPSARSWPPSPTRASSAATRSRAPRPPASSTRAPTCSRARPGT